jgi:AcrR family transcriptional regulator
MICGVAGLRERKKQATRVAIHDAGMRLFAGRGFAGTTVDDIAEAAGVSRATVFTYYATKEEIVFGDSAQAVEGLAAQLRASGEPTVAVVRAWLAQLTQWLEPELLVHLQLAREAPTVGARRLSLYREIEDVIAEALERELGPDGRLAARLGAASLMAGLSEIERAVAAGLSGGAPADTERLLDRTVAYLEAGLEALAET